MRLRFLTACLVVLTAFSCQDDFETDCDKVASKIKRLSKDYDEVAIFTAQNAVARVGEFTIEGNFIKLNDSYFNLCAIKQIYADGTNFQLYFY